MSDAITPQVMKWWIGNGGSSSLNKLPSPNELRLVWRNIAPILIYSEQKYKQNKNYWTTIRSMISKIIRKAVPDPSIDFPGFITVLYIYRKKLLPTKLNHALNLLEASYDEDNISFITLNFPLYLRNPELLFSLFTYLYETEHKIWTKIIHDYHIVTQLFHFYLAFIPDPEDGANIKQSTLLEINGLLTQLISQTMHIKSIKESSIMLAKDYISKVTPVLSCNLFEFNVNAFRTLILCFSLIKDDNEFVVDELSKLLSAVRETPLFKIVSTYIMKNYKKVFPSTKFMRIACIGRTLSNTDIPIIVKYCDRTCGLTAISSLCASAYINISLIRSVFTAMMNLLPKCNEKRLRQWYRGFVHKIFAYIARSVIHKKNGTTVMLSIESFAQLARLNIPWVTKPIVLSASALITARAAPSYIRAFFDRSVYVDSVVYHAAIKIKNHKGGRASRVTNAHPPKVVLKKKKKIKKAPRKRVVLRRRKT